MLAQAIKRNLASSINFSRGQTVSLKEFLFHRLDANSLAGTTTLSKADALKYYKQMNDIRNLENESGRLYMKKAIKGFCHLYSGQEACAVGIEAAISRKDSVITAYRCHGWAYMRGLSLLDILSELTGRQSGCSGGRGGSMHIYADEFYGGNGIVGAQVPLGNGIALSHKLKNTGQICVTLYGDGAANQGQVFEAYNMAALMKLPIIYVCENNLFGMGTSAERSSACADYYTRGDYIPGIRVDGQCVLSVREAFRFCHKWAREGKGPIVVELSTYRYSGHSMSDPGTSYRTKEDVQSIRKTRDPIVQFRELVIDSGIANEAELDEIKENSEQEAEMAAKKCLSEPFPNVAELGHFVYKNGTESGKIRGCTPYIEYDSSR